MSGDKTIGCAWPVITAILISLLSILWPATTLADNIFVGIYFSGAIDEISPGGTVSTFATVAGNPTGMAFDTSGNLFVATSGGAQLNASNIFKITPNGTVTTYATGLSKLSGLAFDANGNLFVSSENGQVYTVSSTGVAQSFATVPGDAEGLAFDTSGTLYCAVLEAEPIEKISPTGVETPFVSPSNAVSALAFDRAGNLYASNDYNAVNMIAPDGTVSTYATGFSQSGCLAFDSSGTLFVTNFDLPGVVDAVSSAGVVTPIATGLGNVYGIAIQVPEPTVGLFSVFLWLCWVLRHRRVDAVQHR